MEVCYLFTDAQRNEISRHVKAILELIGENPDREGLKETPMRVAKMYEEIYSSVQKSDEDIAFDVYKAFTDGADDSADSEHFGNMVIVKDIPFYSTCEHHLVPFFGKAYVGYIPNGKIIGLSKIVRLVDAIAKRPQVQERITNTVADLLVDMLNPVGVMVVIKAEHLCMSMRGIKKPGTTTVTSEVRGCFKDDQSARMEFLQLIK